MSIRIQYRCPQRRTFQDFSIEMNKHLRNLFALHRSWTRLNGLAFVRAQEKPAFESGFNACSVLKYGEVMDSLGRPREEFCVG